MTRVTISNGKWLIVKGDFAEETERAKRSYLVLVLRALRLSLNGELSIITM